MLLKNKREKRKKRLLLLLPLLRSQHYGKQFIMGNERFHRRCFLSPTNRNIRFINRLEREQKQSRRKNDEALAITETLLVGVCSTESLFDLIVSDVRYFMFCFNFTRERQENYRLCRYFVAVTVFDFRIMRNFGKNRGEMSIA